MGLVPANLVGGTTGSFASGDANGGSSDPTTSTPTNDSGWQTTTYAAQGTGDKTRGVQFNVSTAGFSGIKVEFDQRHSNTASKFVQFQYSTDGAFFADFGNLFTASAGDTWFNNRTLDLTAVAGVDNNSNFAFRIVAAFAPGTSTYQPSTGGATYGTAGTNRFDMVQVTGSPVPVPAALPLLLSGLGLVGVARRRRTA